MISAPSLPSAVANPWQSDSVVVRETVAEAPGVTTYRLAFVDERRAAAFKFRPGQFGMLYLPGVGEVPIGISGHCQAERTWSFTVRAAGNTTQALSLLRAGDTLGLRGPFGSAWPLDSCEGADVVLVAGGLGLPPLRPAIYEIIENRNRYGRVTLIYGSRTPDALVYAREFADWLRLGIDVQTTVDRADLDWTGNVGVVPLLVDRLQPLMPERAILLTCGPEVMMRFTVRSAVARGLRTDRIWASTERNMQCAIGLCGHCQFGPEFICKDGPVFRYDRIEPWLKVEALTEMAKKPTLAVFKFASCDGCQLSLLDCEDELLTVADKLHIAYFLEATSHTEGGPFDVALVEGSITTPADAQRIRQVRAQSKFLVTIGACATAGGIQALRNWASTPEYMQAVYARPDFIATLDTSTPIAAHVPVDFELRGCPINKHQLLEVVQSLLGGRRPRTPVHAVCLDCKRRGTVCVMVARGVACLGPVTHTGCGAICPSYDRGCYGCYGPAEQPNLVSLTNQFHTEGHSREETVRLLRGFNAYAPEFRAESDRLEGK